MRIEGVTVRTFKACMTTSSIRCDCGNSSAVKHRFDPRTATGTKASDRHLLRAYLADLRFEVGAHSLRTTAATSALDHQADIVWVQNWLGRANIATTRIYDHRKTRPEDSPTFKVSFRGALVSF